MRLSRAKNYGIELKYRVGIPNYLRVLIATYRIFLEHENQRLRIRVHCASTPAANRALLQLIEQLNEAELIDPGTDMHLT